MTQCNREAEVLEALDTHLGEELTTHVATCVACSELVRIAHAILDDAEVIASEAPIPSSGGVWWRIERRAREEAERKAVQTVSTVQVTTVAIVALLAVVLLGGMTTIRGWIADLAVAVPLTTPLMLGLAALVILTPVAIYFAVTE